VDVVNKLKCRCDEFSYYIAEHQAFLAPIRCLPVELLSHIFSRYSDAAYSKEDDRWSSFQKHPFILATVCRCWRSIVLSAPEIWSKFLVEFDSYDMERDTAITHTWLSRSGACPLSLRLKESSRRSIPDRGRHPMLNAIIPYLDQIKSLDLSVCRETLFAITLNESTFPALQSIKIGITYSYGADPPNTWRALENAPALCRVYFYDLLHPETVKLPWI
jgi:hypothetical protein